MAQLSLYAHPIARTAVELQCLRIPKCLTESCGMRRQHLCCNAPSEGPVRAWNAGGVRAARLGCAHMGCGSEQGKLNSTRNASLRHHQQNRWLPRAGKLSLALVEGEGSSQCSWAAGMWGDGPKARGAVLLMAWSRAKYTPACSASPLPTLDTEEASHGKRSCQTLWAGEWGEVGRRLPGPCSPTQADSQCPFPQLESLLPCSISFLLSCHSPLCFSFPFAFITIISCSNKYLCCSQLFFSNSQKKLNFISVFWKKKKQQPGNFKILKQNVLTLPKALSFFFFLHSELVEFAQNSQILLVFPKSQ